MPLTTYRSGKAKALSERMSPAEIIRFLKKVRVEDGHWVWTGHTDDKGYGQFRRRDRAHWAHRCSYATFVGPIPEGMTVHHKKECLRPGCVCPDCLELLTVEDNTIEGNGRRGACEPLPD